MAHQKWKLLQVTWLPRDTATWTGWSQMELTGGEGQKCEGLSFDSNVPPDPEAVEPILMATHDVCVWLYVKLTPYPPSHGPRGSIGWFEHGRTGPLKFTRGRLAVT